MDCTTETRRYRSVYKYLRIGKREYAVLDKDAAQERADFHLQEALKLLTTELDDNVQQLINQELLVATDFGSCDAAFLLSLRILEPKNHTQFPPQEGIVFLKVAADRGHAEAAYRIATVYASYGKHSELEMASVDYMSGFSLADRRRLAVMYFEQASALGSQTATEDLIMAYAFGRGLLLQNKAQLTTLCESEIQKQNYTVALGYAAWLAKMTVQGSDLLETCVDLPYSPQKSLELLLFVARCPQLQLAQHALFLICEGLKKDRWELTQVELCQRLLKQALQGSQLLSIYIAWYSIPSQEQAKLPALFAKYELRGFADLFIPCEQRALQCLNQALSGTDEDISNLAREIMSFVFGKCYMDDDGVLNLEKFKQQVN